MTEKAEESLPEVKYYCIYCSGEMELKREYIDNNAQIEYFLQCATCRTGGPRISDGGNIDKKRECIEKTFNAMRPLKFHELIVLTCGKCFGDCLGFYTDIHKKCPYPDCDGVVHQIPECERMP